MVFVKGQKVLAYSKDHLYTASVVELKQEQDKQLYLIHYLQWKSTWDEWLEESKVLTGLSNAYSIDNSLSLSLIHKLTASHIYLCVILILIFHIHIYIYR